MRIYAIYKGDKYLCDGTAKECAEKLGVKVSTIYFLASSNRLKRQYENSRFKNITMAIRIGDENE